MKTNFMNNVETRDFKKVSEKNFNNMIAYQRAIMVDKKSDDEEEKRHYEMNTGKDVGLGKTISSKSELAKVTDTDQDVYDSYEEVLTNAENSNNDENNEVVIAQPDNTDNVLLNNQQNRVSSDTMSLMPAPIDDYTSTDFRIFGDTSRFENIIDCSKKSVVECVIAYVQNKSTSKNVLKAVGEQYRPLVKYLKLVETTNNITLMPSVIGVLFMDRFENFLLGKGLASSTVAGIICKLKCVMRWAGGYGAKISADLSNYKVNSTDAKPKIALSEDDIQRIFWFKIENLPVRPQLKRTFTKVRDHFIISCYLGQRYSDTIRVEKTNFTGTSKEVFSIVQQKTSNEVKLNFAELYGKYPKIVKTLLEKYKYKAPWSGDLANYNRYLKKLCEYIGFTEVVKFEYKTKDGQMMSKEFPKYKLITSHVGRRTFITNAVKKNINTQLVKKASGHKSDSSFGKYVILNDGE